MTRQLNVALALVVLLARFPFACVDVAVLYVDARYLLLDSDTLAVVDVGHLGLHGLWRVEGVAPGSTSSLFALNVDRLSQELYRGDEPGHYPSKLVVVDGLAQTDDTATGVGIGHYDIWVGRARWIHQADLLAAWREEPSRFSLFDKDLQEVKRWEVSGHAPDATLACQSRDRTVVGGAGTRFEVGDGVAGPLAFPEGTTKCRMSGTLLGCLASFECLRRGKFVAGVLDLAGNAVVSAFEYGGPFTISKDPAHQRPHSRFENRLLFAGGQRLLQQEELATPDTPGWNSYRIQPTGHIRVLDTASGRVVGENRSAPVGAASRLFAPGGKERFVISGDGKAHLLDLETLETVATASIPQGRHFVF